MLATIDTMDTVGRQFIDAFNRRDPEGLIALADANIEFCPTSLVGARRVYTGHDGLRRWVEELIVADVQHQVRVREVRPLDHSRFVVLSEVLTDGEVISPSAMMTRLADTGRIVEAHSYLTDEQMLTRLGRMDERTGLE